MAPPHLLHARIRIAALALALALAQSAALHAAFPTTNGLFFGDGDLNNYYLLGTDTTGGSKGKIYYRVEGSRLHIALVVNKQGANDAVFGTKAQDDPYMLSANWNAVHTFTALYQSDHATFGIECGATANTPDWAFVMDLLYDADGDQDPTEADWLGDPFGPDGSVTALPPDFQSSTSMAWNMNNTLWDVSLGGTRTTPGTWKSPDQGTIGDVTDDNYTISDDSTVAGNYNSAVQWEWSLVYEFSFTTSTCTTNVSVSPGTSHNSPSKDSIEDTTWNPSPPIDPTYASVAGFDAFLAPGGEVVVEWQTAAEVGSLGFELWRWDPATESFSKVNRRLVPALGEIAGGRYRFVDPQGAEAAGDRDELVYRLVEVDARGARRASGPYAVLLRPGTRPPPAEYTRVAPAPSERLLAAAREAPLAKTLAAVTGRPAAERLRIEIAYDGLYRVPTSQLATALGLPVSTVRDRLESNGFRLTQGGEEIAWHADGKGILFYGQAIDSPFAARNVYWLEAGPGLRMESVAGTPAVAAPGGQSFAETLRFETDVFHSAFVVGDPRQDFWFWRSFLPGDPHVGQAVLRLQVPGAVAGTAATLAHEVVGFEPVHRFRARLNGVSVGEVRWQGKGRHTASLALRGRVLRAGLNELVLIAEKGIFFLDSVSLTYGRDYQANGDRLRFRGDANSTVTIAGFRRPQVTLYDLSDPRRPRRVTGLATAPAGDGSHALSFAPASPETEYLAATAQAAASPPAVLAAAAPSPLRDPGNAAEYLVITDRRLVAGAERLAELRAASGMSTLVVDVVDVMDVFNHGVQDPEAIRRFLAYAADSWLEPPRYVVLAGRGTFDYKNLLGLQSNHVPLYLVATVDGLAPSDSAYGDFDGDGVPEIPVGRIPAVSVAELEDYAAKVAVHEASLRYQPLSTAVSVADNPDHAGDFHRSARLLLASLAPGLTARAIELPVGAGPAQIQQARTQLLNALRSGEPLIAYVGHGGLDRLASEGLLLTSDVPQLVPGGAWPGRLSVLVALTCIVGLHAHPSVASLGEELVVHAGGGAAAVIAPTWLSTNDEATELGRHLLAALSAPGTARLGERFAAALAAYAAGGRPDLHRIYSLLGDPALEMAGD